MGRIREIKKQVRHKEWAAMVQECSCEDKIMIRRNGIEIELPRNISSEVYCKGYSDEKVHRACIRD